MVLHSRFEGAEQAVDIIRSGPEPLVSQFAAGYGMVGCHALARVSQTGDIPDICCRRLRPHTPGQPCGRLQLGAV